MVYPEELGFCQNGVVTSCGKMFWLDRLLVKLFHTPHRVLLFSTMTRLLDLVESYLK
jgi:SNF2 family DNA or RNA helicase